LYKQDRRIPPKVLVTTDNHLTLELLKKL
jgi:hypothetical protein